MKLHLVLKEKWYDLIKSGEKTEEYRSINEYWKPRIWDRKDKIKSVVFHRGYTNITHERELLSVTVDCGKEEWGATPGAVYYVLKVGKTIRPTQPKTNAFDLEKAKRGAEVRMANGWKAKIVDFDFEGLSGKEIIFKYYDEKAKRWMISWCRTDGSAWNELTPYSLVMAPTTAYMNIYKTKDTNELMCGDILPSIEDCERKRNDSEFHDFFSVAKVELLDI